MSKIVTQPQTLREIAEEHVRGEVLQDELQARLNDARAYLSWNVKEGYLSEDDALELEKLPRDEFLLEVENLMDKAGIYADEISH